MNKLDVLLDTFSRYTQAHEQAKRLASVAWRLFDDMSQSLKDLEQHQVELTPEKIAAFEALMKVIQPKPASGEAGAFPAARDARPMVRAGLALVDVLQQNHDSRLGPDWSEILTACQTFTSAVKAFEGPR